MKKLMMYLLVLICGVATASAQKSDTMYQSEVTTKIALFQLDGTSALWFTDANTGHPLVGGQVFIDAVGTFTTDEDGLVLFSELPDGEYVFSITKNGYIPIQDTFEVVFGAILFNKFSVSPNILMEQVKIVLDWSSAPADLDLHLVKDGSYHISYRDKQKAEDGSAWLDRDDTDGYGPETITIGKVDSNATYHIYIHDYSNRNNGQSTRMSASSATVRIYVRNRLEKKFTITVGKSGVTWKVCDFVNNSIIPVNTVE